MTITQFERIVITLEGKLAETHSAEEIIRLAEIIYNNFKD